MDEVESATHPIHVIVTQGGDSVEAWQAALIGFCVLFSLWAVVAYVIWLISMYEMREGTVTWKDRVGLPFAPVLLLIWFAKKVWHGGGR